MKQILILVCWVISGGLTLTALMSAGAQERISNAIQPETTVVPDGAIFTASGVCSVSPDETQLALDNAAVFDLNSLQKLYDITGSEVIYSADSRYFSLRDSAVHDAQTGALVLAASPYNIDYLPPREFSPDGRHFANFDGVYDLETASLVLAVDNSQNGMRGFASFLPNGDVMIRYTTHDETGTLAQSWAILYDKSTFEPIFDTRDYVESVWNVGISPDSTHLVLHRVGIFNYPTMERIADLSMPDRNTQYEIFTTFSPDGTKVALGGLDSDNNFVVQIFDLTSGALMNRFDTPYGDGANPFVFSEDYSAIAIKEADHSTHELWIIRDIETGEVIQRVTTSMFNATEIEGFDSTPSWLTVEPFRVGNRSINIDGDVMDLTTDELIFDVPNRQNPTLTLGGSYVLTQDPCTVWVLP